MRCQQAFLKRSLISLNLVQQIADRLTYASGLISVVSIEDTRDHPPFTTAALLGSRLSEIRIQRAGQLEEPHDPGLPEVGCTDFLDFTCRPPDSLQVDLETRGRSHG